MTVPLRDEGWARVVLLLDEAQRFHAHNPSSARCPGPRSRLSSAASSAMTSPETSVEAISHAATPLPEPLTVDFWQQLRDHVAAHWITDPTPPDFKYHAVKQWLTGLDLWRLDGSWDECKLDAPARRAAADERRRARIASLPRGQLFL